MPVNDSKSDNANDFPAVDDSYKSGAGEINATGIGATTTAGETFDRVGTAAAEFNDSAARPLGGNISRQAAEISDDVINDDSPMSWLIPLIIVFLLIILGYSFCNKAPDAKTAVKYQSAAAKVNVA